MRALRPDGRGLVERDEQITAALAFLREAGSDGGVLTVQGDAGIGKTSLVQVRRRSCK